MMQLIKYFSNFESCGKVKLKEVGEKFKAYN